MISWRFKPNSKDDMDVDPIQAEFFTTRDIDNISTAVVREGVQNALDERNRGVQSETVRVRIFLSGNKYALTKQEYSPLISDLIPHLRSQNPPMAALPDFEDKMNYFVFEDFNTKGLDGSLEESFLQANNDGKPHNFYYFWRNVGRSGKSGDSLGRWGLGKTVFPASSRICTFWGLTVRKSDQRKMLMGQSILRTHNRNDHKQVDNGYKPYGFFGNYQDETYFALPVENEHNNSEFETLFRLERDQQPGLSLVIPFCSEEITIDHLAYSVIEQYFYPILEGRLEVEIGFEDEKIMLSKNSISEAVDQINFERLYNADERKKRSRENLNKLFDFAKWTFQLHDKDYFQLKELNLDAKPRWNKNVLFVDEEGMNVLRDKFDEGERIAFRVPLKYHPAGGQPKTCWYSAYLEKDTSLAKPENLFVRDGITISGITSLDKGMVRGVVVIHDADLARMLGDSENPAHTEWQADSRNFKGKYVDGKEALGFVKATLKNIYDKLQRPVEGIQKDLLIDFFSIPVEAMEEKKHKDLPKKRKEGDDETEEAQVPEVQTRKRPLIIEKIPSGLRLVKNPEATEAPESLKLKLGYDVPRGNPINSYQEFDFDISKSPIKIESTGIYFTKKEKNILEFNIENPEAYEIKLTGFDEKRDLFLKMQ